MKHATPGTIKKIETLLDSVRCIDGLKEKKPGIYHYKASAFLHFHEIGDEIYADIKLVPPNFERLPVTTTKQQDYLIKSIKDFFKL